MEGSPEEEFQACRCPRFDGGAVGGREKNIRPLRWTKGALEALHEGTEGYMTGLMEDANLLAIHTRRYMVQPRDIQLARRIWGEANWDMSDYTY